MGRKEAIHFKETGLLFCYYLSTARFLQLHLFSSYEEIESISSNLDGVDVLCQMLNFCAQQMQSMAMLSATNALSVVLLFYGLKVCGPFT
jgi:hypothetical protein